MNLKTFTKTCDVFIEKQEVFYEHIRKVFIALNEYDKYNGMRHDLDAYLHYMYLWAIEGDERPNPKDFGLE